jgi:hypothetical protein
VERASIYIQRNRFWARCSAKRSLWRQSNDSTSGFTQRKSFLDLASSSAAQTWILAERGRGAGWRRVVASRQQAGSAGRPPVGCGRRLVGACSRSAAQGHVSGATVGASGEGSVLGVCWGRRGLGAAAWGSRCGCASGSRRSETIMFGQQPVESEIEAWRG